MCVAHCKSTFPLERAIISDSKESNVRLWRIAKSVCSVYFCGNHCRSNVHLFTHIARSVSFRSVHPFYIHKWNIWQSVRSSSVIFRCFSSRSLSVSFSLFYSIILSIHVLCAWMLLLNPHIRHTGCLCASLPLYMAFIITTNSNTTTTTLDYYQILLANSNVRFKTIYYYTDPCAPFIRTYLAQSHCLLHTPWLLCAYSNSNNKSNRKTHW